MASDESIRALLDKMAAERASLLAQAKSLTPEAAAFAPPDGEGEAQWSPKQQLAHLAEMETAYRAWVERALAEDEPDVTRVAGDPPGIPLTAAHDSTVAELTAQLQAQRETTLAVMAAMAPEQYDRGATHRAFGRLTVMQWLRSYYRHDRMHRDQMAGRDPDYKPKFAGGVEPDQRRGPRI